MSAVTSSIPMSDANMMALIKYASSQIAPQWPLDQLIAVNPWWPKRQQLFSAVCAEQQLLAGTDCLMSAQWYLTQYPHQITAQHLRQALVEAQLAISVDEAVAALSKPVKAGHWQRLTEHLCGAGRHNKLPWQELIVQQLSQFLALYHQYPERFSVEADSKDHAYHSWLSVVRQDKGLQVLTGTKLTPLFVALPDQPGQLLAQMQPWLESWCADEQSLLAYFEALLQSLSGWAGWQAWLDWQQQLQGNSDNDAVCQLLYMLLGWDWVLWQHSQQQNAQHSTLLPALQLQARQYNVALIQAQKQLAVRQVWQRALELSVQQPLLNQLQQQQLKLNATSRVRPAVQAAFCIDVRSEPMRRALEQQHCDIQTLGFAGFFGLPIAYKAADGPLQRPQLPGLLAPALTVTQVKPDSAPLSRQPNLGWKQSFDLASSSLGMVEAAGPTKLLSLIKRAFLRPAAPHALNKLLDDSRWQLLNGQQALTDAEQASLAAAILTAMGLATNLAPVVLLFGHGSNSCNNPHAAALDCGACGGQTGEVNVKVLAQMLNDDAVRQQLSTNHGIAIAPDTRFYAGMHHTTTDELQVYQTPAQADWLSWLTAAGTQARQQRATQFGQTSQTDSALARFFKLRSNDWAQLRPEWGLANNAAFIVAPRQLTKELDLKGRAFLHDYDASKDTDFSLLHTIMTAPMVVTNWINLQYYASVVAPDKYGCGNKLLHNVVAGHIGVFEGNGGDLRTGLAWQSVHDGIKLMHQPVRLSVVIAAPREAIAGVISRSADVAALVNNHWLYLYQLADDGSVHQWQQHSWQPVTL
ncbi:putative inorganic carbon transporter subunit DabA [Rheinheimera gaetbuli]